MNCQEFWNNPREAEAGGHLDRCASCAAAWEQQRIMAAGLRGLAAAQREDQAPAHVEARLVAAFRGHVSLGSGRPQPRWIPYLTWGAAAAALVAVAFLLVQDRAPEGSSRAAMAVLQTADAMESADSEAAGFIPLPYAAEVDPNEEVNLVRLELPRATMLALGFEVGADGGSEAVAADVMLGPDGLARAVRFLDE